MTTTTQPAGPAASAASEPGREAPGNGGLARLVGPGAVRLIRSELLKLWTTNTWWIFGILAVVSTGLALTGNLFRATDELSRARQLLARGLPRFGGTLPDGTPVPKGPSPQELADMKAQWLHDTDIPRILATNAANVFTSGQFLGLLFVVILSVLVVTNEFHHQTATTTFLTTPHRTSVIASKLGAAALLATAFWSLSTLISVSIGSVVLANGDYSASLTQWPIIRSVLMNLLAYVIWAVLGVGVGVLIRSQLGGTLTGAGMYLASFPAAFIVFGVIRQFLIKDDRVFDYMVAAPGVASQVMITPDRFDLGPRLSPSWWVGGLVLIGYGVLAGVIGTLLTRKRDIS
jgi:ABC-2 type transport system permease protein